MTEQVVIHMQLSCALTGKLRCVSQQGHQRWPSPSHAHTLVTRGPTFINQPVLSGSTIPAPPRSSPLLSREKTPHCTISEIRGSRPHLAIGLIVHSPWSGLPPARHASAPVPSYCSRCGTVVGGRGGGTRPLLEDLGRENGPEQSRPGNLR